MIKPTQEQIKKGILDYLNDCGQEELTDAYDLEQITYQLGDETDVLPFTVVYRQNYEGNDDWLQVEYYSPKLGKTLIWDWNYTWEMTVDELAQQLFTTSNEVCDFEDKLPSISSSL